MVTVVPVRAGILSRPRRSPLELRGALVLICSTVAALVWANLPGESYAEFWHAPLGVVLGGLEFRLDVRHWVNDALMAVFFAHVTLEVRRELELGDLRDGRRASVPVIAAVAGLVFPALVYVSLTWGTDFVGGWGIVVSTDTAFVLGVLALVGRSLPPQLRVFLVTLVVADDVGALGVIAFAYTDGFSPLPLALAAAGLAAIVLMRVLRVWRGPLYVLPSLVVWIGFLLSGVHATLAGVAIALLLPIFPTRLTDVRRAQERMRVFQISPDARSARNAEESLAQAVSVNERAHRALTPYVTWLILPVFALANAGVRLTPEALADAFTSVLTWGIIAGLVIGKVVGIAGATWTVVRRRPDALGPRMRMSHILGVSMLAGMGFTISLFVAELAFDDPVDNSRAQIGILTATVIAALFGTVTLLVLGRRERRRSPNRGRLVRPLDARRDPVLGDAHRALVTVIEYGDYARRLPSARQSCGRGSAVTSPTRSDTSPSSRRSAELWRSPTRPQRRRVGSGRCATHSSVKRRSRRNARCSGPLRTPGSTSADSSAIGRSVPAGSGSTKTSSTRRRCSSTVRPSSTSMTSVTKVRSIPRPSPKRSRRAAYRDRRDSDDEDAMRQRRVRWARLGDPDT